MMEMSNLSNLIAGNALARAERKLPRPSTYETFIHNTLPVLTGAQGRNMKSISRAGAIAMAAMCLIGNHSVHAAEVTDSATIVRLEKAWVTAIAEGDRAFNERFLHPDAIVIAENGEVFSRETVVKAPARQGTSQSLDDLQVRVYGDTAIVTGISRYRSSATAAPLSIRFVAVLLHGGPEGWQVVSSQGTPISR